MPANNAAPALCGAARRTLETEVCCATSCTPPWTFSMLLSALYGYTHNSLPASSMAWLWFSELRWHVQGGRHIAIQSTTFCVWCVRPPRTTHLRLSGGGWCVLGWAFPRLEGWGCSRERYAKLWRAPRAPKSPPCPGATGDATVSTGKTIYQRWQPRATGLRPPRGEPCRLPAFHPVRHLRSPPAAEKKSLCAEALSEARPGTPLNRKQ